MEFDLLGWPADGPQLDLDHERFSYAGKFVMTTTGKAVVRADDGGRPEGGRNGPAESGAGEESDEGASVIAAASFSADRTDDATLWIRYVTVRADYRGNGIAPPLADFVSRRAVERGFDRVRIAVNNPFAYHALYKAGFAYTGDRSGLAELVLERPAERDEESYQRGLDEFRERDLSTSEAEFLREKAGARPPQPVDPSSER